MFAIIVLLLAIYIGYHLLKGRFNSGKWIFSISLNCHPTPNVNRSMKVLTACADKVDGFSKLFSILFKENVKGKNVVITGASTGIGEELAYQYARLGANIVITSNEERLTQVLLRVLLEVTGCQSATFYFYRPAMKLREFNNVLHLVYRRGRLSVWCHFMSLIPWSD